jgi:hypothetical protein
MQYFSVIGLLAFLPFAFASDSPPKQILELCKQRGQVPQQEDGKWKCATVQTSDICNPDQDLNTLHKDPKTGQWICCPRGQDLKQDSCVQPGGKGDQIPIPLPGTCGSHLKDAGLESLLREILVHCFPHDQVALDVFIEHYLTVLNGNINLIEVIYKNGCGKPTPNPDPISNWKCPRDNSPCKWLPLENNKVRKTLSATGSDHKVLPNPNVPVVNYKYPFDTWVVGWPDDDLSIYVKDQKLQPQASGTSYLIPAGTSADDVYYKSPKGAQIQFFGACSADTPCIGEEVAAWVEGKPLYTTARDQDIDVSGYDFDLVFTIADTWVTTEQYTVLADGKEVGKTHGPLSLGDDKYNTKHIASTVDVGRYDAGALKSISNAGFWGSFRIPKETKKVTVRLGTCDSINHGYFVFEYRMDKLCQC